MLRKEAVDTRTLELIQTLQKDKRLKGFCLAGGTTLALFLGHRKSIDIELFTQQDFNTQQLLEHLEHTYDFSMQYNAKNTLKGTISGIFVDLIAHKYPLITEKILRQ